jgi:tRNA A37 threonylcarbamoyltransferase TsaD
VRKHAPQQVADLAASFQQAVVDVLVAKTSKPLANARPVVSWSVGRGRQFAIAA